MRKIVFVILFLSSVAVLAKNEDVAPGWMTLEGRETLAPKHNYYSAFSQVRYLDKKSVPQSISEAKSFAKKYLVEAIESNVKSVTESRFVESGVGKKSAVSSSYKSNVFSSADIDVVGLQMDYFVSAREKMIYAFAYLKKDDLFSYYNARVVRNLSVVENEISVANEALGQGDVSKARKSYSSAEKRLLNAQNDESVLVAVNSSKAAAVSVKINQAVTALREIETALSKCLRVYVQSEENVFGRSTNVLSNKLCNELSSEKCCIVTDSNEADYTLSITAKTRKADFQSEFKFSYADVVYEMKNNKTGLIVLKDGFAYKSGGTNYEKAGYEALARSSAKIFQSIKEILFDY